MNVFILNTGRCGSMTIIKACQHISNYTSAHESRCNLLGSDHFTYPENHIEADNRLSWFLGRLDRHYGDNAFYVHLIRDDNATATSFVRRYNNGIIKAYRTDILMSLPDGSEPLSVALDYCDTVNSNIECFLKDKSRRMEFRLENARQDFSKLWEQIGAVGDLDAALAEFDTRHNKSEGGTHHSNNILSTWLSRRVHRLSRTIQKLFTKLQ